MGALLTEELKNRSNFMWKMAEKEQLDPIQRLLYDKYKQQGGGTFDNVMPNAPMSENAMGGVYGGRPPAGIERQGMGAMPEEMGADLLSPESRSYVDITGGGKLGVKTAPIAESILKRLTDKEMRGMPLSEKEKALKARLENKVYGRVNQPKGATQYDQDATDTVYNNIVSHIENGDEAEVEADIEDLKNSLKFLMDNRDWRIKMRGKAWETSKGRDERRMSLEINKLYYSIWRRELALMSVIIPTRDRPKVFMECLIGALQQDYPKYEIVVADSGDTSVKLIIDEARKRSDVPIKYKSSSGK